MRYGWGGGKVGTRVVGWISVFQEGHLECKKFRVYHMCGFFLFFSLLFFSFLPCPRTRVLQKREFPCCLPCHERVIKNKEVKIWDGASKRKQKESDGNASLSLPEPMNDNQQYCEQQRKKERKKKRARSPIKCKHKQQAHQHRV